MIMSIFAPSVAAQEGAIQIRHPCGSCDPNNYNDPETNAILSMYQSEDPGSIVYISN